MYSKQFYLFDLDGTLTYTVSGRICAKDFDDFLIAPNVLSILEHLHGLGKRFAIVTNQGGVSHGIMNEKQTWETLLECNSLLHGMISTIKVSYYHEKGKVKQYYLNNAKPKPDMLLHAMADLQSKLEVKLPVEQFAYIGNAFTDEEAAKNAGMPYFWAHDFFQWPKEQMVTSQHGMALRDEFLSSYRVDALKGQRIAGIIKK